MDQLPSTALVKILGEFSATPSTALDLSQTSRLMYDSMDDSWAGLYHHWAKRFGDRSPALLNEHKARGSKRLKRAGYYSPHHQFLRLVRLSRVHCNLASAELAQLPAARAGTKQHVTKVVRIVKSLVPLWPSAVLVNSALLSKGVKTNEHATAVVSELMMSTSIRAEVDVKTVCIACALGFPGVVERVLPLLQGTVLEPKLSIRVAGNVDISGTRTALQWAETAAAREAKTWRPATSAASSSSRRRRRTSTNEYTHTRRLHTRVG